MWSSMCALMRAAISATTLCPGFAKSLSSSMSAISRDSHLMTTSRPQKTWLLVSNAVAVLLTTLAVSANIFMYNQSPAVNSDHVDYMFYYFLLQSIVFATSWIFGCQFLSMVALSTLRRMFNAVASAVEKWARSELQPAKEFQVALKQHTLAWRLTETFDRVFSFVIGLNFIFSIPIVCIITSLTVKILSERPNNPQLLGMLWYLVPWNGSCIFFTVLTCVFASAVNTAAHKPLHYVHKMERGCNNPDVVHFLERLKGNSIGFTFFRFFVIEKTTLLSIFSLTVTYLIVFLQMAQFA